MDFHGSKMENVHLKFIQENYFCSNVNTSESWEVASATFHLKKKDVLNIPTRF